MIMTEPATAAGLREWARGMYATEAAVELLLRSFHGQFASAGQRDLFLGFPGSRSRGGCWTATPAPRPRVPIACGSTREAVCPPCARKARVLRMRELMGRMGHASMRRR
jgi:hypothetical protein